MKFSTSVDMALRILVYLAEREDAGLASAPEVSQALQVSYNNVVRVINRLQNAGLVVNHAGRYGGMELAMSVDKITVKDVASAIDGPTKLSPCIYHSKDSPRISGGYVGYHNCEISKCSVREELIELNAAIDTLLDSVTIAAIAERHIERKSRQQALQAKATSSGQYDGCVGVELPQSAGHGGSSASVLSCRE